MITWHMRFQSIVNYKEHEPAWDGTDFEALIDVRLFEIQFGQTEAHELFIANRQQYIKVLGKPPDFVI
jgi:hypothetical protein